MNRTSFNDDWRVRPKVNAFMELLGGGAQPWVAVRLPHDAMIGGERDPGRPLRQRATSPAASGSTQKTFVVARGARGKRILLEFEGVYRSASVYVNGTLVGHRPVRLLELRGVDRRAPALRRGEHDRGRGDRARDARWYSGAGIYRTGPPRRRRAGAPRARRRARDHPGRRRRRRGGRGRDRRGERLARHDDHDGHDRDRRRHRRRSSLATSAPLTMFPGRPETLRQRLFVAQPRRWSVDQPALYTCRTVVLDDDGAELDRRATDLRHPHDRGRRRSVACASTANPSSCAARASTTTTACSARDHRPRRRAPGRDAQGGRLQRAAQRAPPDEPGDARRVRPHRHARDGRDLRHVDRAQDGRRLRARVPRLVGGRRRRDGAQGPQPPLRDHVLDRQRDPRHRRRLPGAALGPCDRRADPRARRHPPRHQLDQPHARRAGPSCSRRSARCGLDGGADRATRASTR